MTLDEEKRRGDEAQRLLEEPLLIEAFKTIEQELTQAWMESPARDAQGREKTWLMLKLLHKVRGNLESMVANGTMAKASILERAKRIGRTISR